MRKNLKECKSKLEPLEIDLKEFEKQNELLKQEIERLLAENKDLKEVVGYFSRYLYLMKKSHEYVKELSKLIKEVDPEVEEKLEDILDKQSDEEITKVEKKW